MIRLDTTLNNIYNLCINFKNLNQNQEQFEVFINMYCSIAQPLLVSVNLNHNTQIVKNIIQLIEFLFTTMGHVQTGGLLILFGLIHSV